jgi:hypothetical protein
MRPCIYDRARFNGQSPYIRVLSKEKPKLKSQILKEKIIKSMIGQSLSNFKITDKTKLDIHTDTTSIEDYNSSRRKLQNTN